MAMIPEVSPRLHNANPSMMGHVSLQFLACTKHWNYPDLLVSHKLRSSQNLTKCSVRRAKFYMGTTSKLDGWIQSWSLTCHLTLGLLLGKPRFASLGSGIRLFPATLAFLLCRSSSLSSSSPFSLSSLLAASSNWSQVRPSSSSSSSSSYTHKKKI